MYRLTDLPNYAVVARYRVVVHVRVKTVRCLPPLVKLYMYRGTGVTGSGF